MVNEEDQPSGFTFGESTIIFDGEKILALTEGKISSSCTVSDFMRRPNAVFRQIMGTVKRAAELDSQTE